MSDVSGGTDLYIPHYSHALLISWEEPGYEAVQSQLFTSKINCTDLLDNLDTLIDWTPSTLNLAGMIVNNVACPRRKCPHFGGRSCSGLK